MILSGLKIAEEIEAGHISIKPFDVKRLNPNSYNVTLHDELLVYQLPDFGGELDMKAPCETARIKIPKDGFVLQPGQLYLGRTVEWTETKNHVPMLEGRSSVGRLGVFIHVTAGFGDVGFRGHWTLEICCIRPVRIYAGVEIGQLIYHQIHGDFTVYQSSKYQDNDGIQASRLWMDFQDA